MNIGYGFGQNGWIRPEVRLGWRQNFSVDAGTTIARFASGGRFGLAQSLFQVGSNFGQSMGPLLAAFIHVASELTFILNSARLLPGRADKTEAAAPTSAAEAQLR